MRKVFLIKRKSNLALKLFFVLICVNFGACIGIFLGLYGFRLINYGELLVPEALFVLYTTAIVVVQISFLALIMFIFRLKKENLLTFSWFYCVCMGFVFSIIYVSCLILLGETEIMQKTWFAFFVLPLIVFSPIACSDFLLAQKRIKTS